MRVSIITVCFNSIGTIQDTFQSVADQSYTDIEHLIIDGGSTDGTLELIEKYAASQPAGRVKWISEQDKGLYDAMNKGLSRCTGEVVGFLNSDDFFAYPDAVADLASLFQSSAMDCIYADLNYVDGLQANNIIRRWKSGNYKKNSFLWGWMPPHPTFYAKTALYKVHGNYRLDLKSASDYELMLRFLYKNKCKAAYLPKTLVHMRTGGISNASLKNRFMANRMDRQAWIVNDLRPYFFTLLLKPSRKISQFTLFSGGN